MQKIKSYSLILTLAACSSLFGNAAKADAKLEKVIAGDHRTEAYAKRDEFRHPLETLKFFGIKDDMTVIELSPGGGWYTEILAPYLRDNGTFIAAAYDKDSKSEYYSKSGKKYEAKLAAKPAVYDKTKITILQPPEVIDFGTDNSADLIVAFRNAHHWHRKGDADEIYAEIFRTLKPGGIFGIVQHRAGEKFPEDKSGNKGYLEQSAVIKKLEAAGLKLVDSSEVNANPKDTKDYKNGVWGLPPSLRAEEGNKEKNQAIGESDRMTLKFMKPKK